MGGEKNHNDRHSDARHRAETSLDGPADAQPFQPSAPTPPGGAIAGPQQIDPSDWNDPIARRRFLKQSGSATAATLLAWHGMRVEVYAQGSGIFPKKKTYRYVAYLDIDQGSYVVNQTGQLYTTSALAESAGDAWKASGPLPGISYSSDPPTVPGSYGGGEPIGQQVVFNPGPLISGPAAGGFSIATRAVSSGSNWKCEITLIVWVEWFYQ